MSWPDPDEPVEPVRVAEAGVAAYQWDQWQATATRSIHRAERFAVVAAIVAAVVVAAVGLIRLPGDGRFSVALYTPFAGWAAWAGTRHVGGGWGLDTTIDALRAVVVPQLVDDITTAGLESLLHHGGTLVTERSTVIVSERRDSLVVLVATEYDPRDMPPQFVPMGSGGP